MLLIEVDVSNIGLVTLEYAMYLKSLFPSIEYKQRKNYDEYNISVPGTFGSLHQELAFQDVLDLSGFFEVSIYGGTIRLS